MKKKEPPISSSDEDFIADSKAAVLNKTTFLESSILYTIALFIIVALIWSYFATIDQITTTSGKVIPSSRDKIIQSLDGGIIKNIYVTEGSAVEPNQILLKLDDTRYTADYENGYEKYLSLTATAARLTAETTQNINIDFPEELKRDHPELVKRETKLFEERRKNSQTEGLLLQDVLGIAVKELEMYSKLVSEGTVSMLDFYHSQRNVDDVKEKILQKQATFRENALLELNQIKAELASLKEQLTGLRDRITNSTIRSPVHGIVKKVSVTTIGGVINPGMDIMEIVPLTDSLLVEVHLSPSEIAFIRVGQPATVKFTAYDYTIYGSLNGVVEYVGADTVEEQKPILPMDANEKTPNIYYVVKIRTNHNYIGNPKNPLPILPGMTVTAYIVTGHKTILDYLLKPLLKAKEEALRER